MDVRRRDNRGDNQRKRMRTLDQDMRRYLANVMEIVVLMAFLIIVTVLFARLFSYILPFVLGLVIAVVLFPLVRVLQSAGMTERSAVLVVMVGSIGVLAALVTFVVIQAAQEAVGFSQAIPVYFSFWRDWMERMLHQGMAVYGHLPPKVVATFQTTALGTVEQAKQFAVTLFASLFTGVALLPDVVIIGIIAVVAAYFFLAQREEMLSLLRRALPPGWAPKLEVVAIDVSHAIAGMLRTQLILIGVTSVICIVGMALMHIRYAFILGLSIGLTGWIPIVGSGIVTLPWAVGAFLGGHVVLAIKILLLQTIASLVRHTIEPKIMAASVGLGTFATMFGMYVGLRSMGFFGLVIGPIVLIAIRSLIRARIFGGLLPNVPEPDHQPPQAEIERRTES